MCKTVIVDFNGPAAALAVAKIIKERFPAASPESCTHLAAKIIKEVLSHAEPA